jgi:hypothetical protein
MKEKENTRMETDQTWKPFQLAEIPTLILFLFADDQILLARSEEDLEISILWAKNFPLRLILKKIYIMAFREMEQIRSKFFFH